MGSRKIAVFKEPVSAIDLRFTGRIFQVGIIKLNRFAVAASLLVFFLSVPAFSQSDITIESEIPEEEPPAVFEALPSGRGSILLGMDIEAVKEELLKDPDFSYRGEPDVSMLPNDERQVIDCDGSLYVDRGYFQFNEDKLYLITMVLDEEYVDHYSIYAALKKKYGEPTALDPAKTVWENDSVRISLERPLSIKYIDLDVFRQLQQESAAEASFESGMRRDFIDSF